MGYFETLGTISFCSLSAWKFQEDSGVVRSSTLSLGELQRMGQDWDILEALKDGEKDPWVVYQRESHAKDTGFFLLPGTESKKNIQVQP